MYSRMQVAETLVQADTQGELQPLLARSWVVSDDYLTWIITLQDNVQFHNGAKFDAEAVTTSTATSFPVAVYIMVGAVSVKRF